ncbi:hypothetical protein BAUCODRAFT_152181 [Baudoinia panamericana UAMH 10762]|uniref:Pyridoxamine 5'-phosphate oxidase Alr4036 family FMN-binding domain-containing protein n=1 Tax=Baudoinia panamericana (strain UAMH 10762) TaxID=717646 RepID=M2MYR1_BAUPA|nr:uncharacterized protein BAUCODRAFT_152181 [Baudoinia panamericana UAMH 10762]EMC91814.1 hypothetical protein BAUCODRAFT_152181 [Baudoinia panamericana UAMH 10762]
MSSTSTTGATPQPAPWKSSFLDHLGKMDSPEFVFSSLHPAPNKDSPTPYLPRARYCIFRGFWAELPENKHNDAPRNERSYESEMPTFTTDVRMQKPFELFSSSSGHADKEEQAKGSGGGGPCEAVWWIKGDTMVQWRVRGEAFVVGPDIEEENESSGVRTVKSEVGSRMRVAKEEEKEKWSWKTELVGHFGNMSPGMRGSFKNPPPGQAVDKPYDEEHLKLGEKVSTLDDAVARENFRVVIIKPEMVESLDLKDPTKARRQQYRYQESTGKWSHVETWP